MAGTLRSTLYGVVGAIVANLIACGPSPTEVEAKDRTIAELRSENSTLRDKVRELETAIRETPDTLFAEAQEAHQRKDYATALRAAELLLAKHPSSDRVQPARNLAATARKKLAEADARRRTEAEQADKRERRTAEAARRSRIREIRELLHRNLDGAGDGFVREWEWSGDLFVLVVDERKYVPNSAIAAAVTARSIFDTSDVPLPQVLVFRDRHGNEMDRGPFANVPRVVP